jgi:tRNA pseudouridine38-40 synthase
MYAFRIAYDGRPFHGFQRQPDVDTVADAILDALAALEVPFEGDVPPNYAAAGRTDAGVSALAQTVAFDAPAWLRPRALSAELPDSIRAWARAEVPPDFHATHDATRRTYRYHLYAPALDDDRARAAAERLAGRHDFHNLTPDATGTERDLAIDLRRAGDVLRIRVAADGFPRQLVRRLVTVIERVGRGDLSPSAIDALLGPEPVEGPNGIPPAAPTPLVLADVTYPSLSFTADEVAREAARAVFADLAAERAAAASVADDIAAGLDC